MRIVEWRGKEVLEEISLKAETNGRNLMDEVVARAKQLVKIGKITREGKFTKANITINPKRGSNKGKIVTFSTDRRWTGRYPGQLRDTIRRVVRFNRRGNIRVYAGDHKVYWGLMLERGTINMRKKPFLRPAFREIASMARVKEAIKNGV